MAKFTAAALQTILARGNGARSLPRVFVETGTWHGDSTRLALTRFAEVHTIELSATLFGEYSPALTEAGAHCYQGDTRVLLPQLALTIQEPVCWFLDAHWTDQCAGAMRGPLPLWEELEVLSGRTYADIVIVDDVHSFGTHRAAALKERPARAVLFKEQPEWDGVSLSKIAKYFPKHREAVILGDQAVVYRG
jgi:hypothetical protein